MLGKLLKHEFWATSRAMVPIYAGSLILALINRLLMSISFGDNFHAVSPHGGVFTTVLTSVFIFLFVIVMAAIPVTTAIFIIRRFYTHLLKDEGYLTHTLPVGIDGLLWSKLIPAFSWAAASAVVMFFSIVILLGGIPFLDYFREFLPSMREVLGYLGGYRLSIFLTIIILILLSFNWILHFYISLSIGQLANRRKILAAIGVYFGIYFASSIVTTAVFQAMIFSNIDHSANSALLVLLFGSLIPCAVYYLITRYLLKNRLNLE